ncbi:MULTISPECIES: transcription antitermination factor NusB [Corynebacterium]|uniref:Transcription antitermination protein NusB n=1 Tax=Corynebacterium hadale TaxID=2026255 RepID=A0A269PDP6_9CORY|nr:transcription antitermination factor NusB [Corynebacterium hadale]WKC60210.1 hypothetical protein CHAD_06680 [Corynebacterium hadale]
MPDYKRHGARYRARRRAVDILFEAETRDVDPVEIVEDRAELSRNPQNSVAPVADYTRQIISGAAEQLDDLDDAIERYLVDDWELFRLPAVDRQILRVCAWEIMYNEDVDAPISIKEGVEMAAEYSGASASPYINVVLDGIAQRGAPESPFGDDAESAVGAEGAEGTEETGVGEQEASSTDDAQRAVTAVVAGAAVPPESRAAVAEKLES